jgi:hypothetical protein
MWKGGGIAHGKYIRYRDHRVARSWVVLPPKTRCKVFPHLLDAPKGRKIILSHIAGRPGISKSYASWQGLCSIWRNIYSESEISES